jgi:hypothetical protein
MSSAAELTRLLGGRWHGRYGLARCVVHEDRSPSLSILDGERGPVLKCFAGCDWRDIRAELQRRRLLEPEWGNTRPPGSSHRRNGDYERQQCEKAGWLWSQRRPIKGTPAERYLRRARGYSGTIPETLGFVPPSKREHHPALISAYAVPNESEPGVLRLPRDVSSVHLTLLRPDGSGKADVEHPKLTIASPRGQPIALAPPNDLLGLAITEGIEDALTAHAATGLGAWAAGSAPLMPTLAPVVPGYIETVTIYGHNDGGRQSALQLADRLRESGFEVFIEGLAS